MGHSRGFLVPLLTWVFNILKFISPLTIVCRLGKLFHKSWERSYLVVEIYVIVWFLLLLSFIWLVSVCKLHPLIIIVLSTWRLSDITQSWFNIFMDVEPRVLSPVRSLLLAVVNYFELAVSHNWWKFDLAISYTLLPSQSIF